MAEPHTPIPIPRAIPIPITVIGGYLGAGKTTLLNRLLVDPGCRRLGVIVNDFGSIGIDAELLASASDTGVVNLPNGCVCCTLGGDLFEALAALRGSDAPPDQIVIEASGVADPAVAAAWGTSAGFAPGGVIVLAAADSIARQVRDKYVGGEVRRQLAGADLIVLTKSDLCDDVASERARAVITHEAPDVTVIDPDAPADVILGVRHQVAGSRVPDEANPRGPAADPHASSPGYSRWSWSCGVVHRFDRDMLAAEMTGVLRLKGVLDMGDRHIEVQVVGGRTNYADRVGLAAGSRVEAVLGTDGPDGRTLTSTFDALMS